MADIQFSINFDLNYLLDVIDRLSGEGRNTLYERVNQAVEDGSDLLMANWTEEATISLPGSSGGYVNAISKDPQGWAHIAVINNHPAAVYLELGIDAFDMKKMLQTSSKVKISKDGKKYMHIPFEHKRDDLIKAGVDPQEISEMQPSTRDPRKWGDRLTDFGDVGRKTKYFIRRQSLRDLHAQKVSEGMDKGKVSYEWKTSMFENTYKFKDTKTGQTESFKSFRTISENSDPMSWIHPGIRAMNITGNAVEKTKPIFFQSVSEIVEQVFREEGFSISA